MASFMLGSDGIQTLPVSFTELGDIGERVETLGHAAYEVATKLTDKETIAWEDLPDKVRADWEFTAFGVASIFGVWDKMKVMKLGFGRVERKVENDD